MSHLDEGSSAEGSVSPSGEGDSPATGAPTEPDAPTRPRRRWVATVVLGAIVVAALAYGAWYAYREVERSRDIEARFTAARDRLAALEADLLLVDAAVQEGLSSASETATADALDRAGVVAEGAREVSATIAGLMSDLPDEQVPLANALKASAAARAEMMDEAPLVLETDLKAAAAIVAADAALAEIKAADESIAKASTEFNRHVKAGVEASTAHSSQAELHLNAAKSAFTTATAAFPEADFSSFVGYVDAKLALVAEAKAIDALWLAGKLAESNTRLDAYNTKEAAIVEMAKALPESVRDPIADAYESVTSGAIARYYEARERARAAGDEVERLQAALDAKQD